VTPSIGLRFLRDCEWVENFPMLAKLIGCPQWEKYHPEGDVWDHTLHVCDEMAKLGGDRIDILAALFHDIGKPSTTKIHDDGKITSYSHAEVGAQQTNLFFVDHFKEYILKECAEICKLVQIHMYRPQVNFTSKSVRKFMHLMLKGTTLQRFEKIVRADHYGRPPLPKSIGEHFENFLLACEAYKASNDIGPLVRGQDLIDKGYEEGPRLGEKLKYLYTRQINDGLRREDLLKLC
jgi:tRNA nucleotidyltransferase (CCA-adding enzyme)